MVAINFLQFLFNFVLASFLVHYLRMKIKDPNLDSALSFIFGA